mmetsp:Transcript_6342/g.7376  ORF Transcript_6342/g.7376 Transcript_6342/m.7376 type:complete len:358 (-) Transcript_6342:214-1287(-)
MSVTSSKLLKPYRTTANFASIIIHGPDRKGIVSAYSRMLDQFGCGIVESEQWTDRLNGMFFQRILFDVNSGDTGGGHADGGDGREGGKMSSSGRTTKIDIKTNTNGTVHPSIPMFHHRGRRREIEEGSQSLREKFGLDRALINWREKKKRVAVMVSRYDHCLWEILLRYKANELDCDIKVILSNHPDLKPVADAFGIPFVLSPKPPTSDGTTTNLNAKLEQEKKELDLLLGKMEVDVVVLARYMQVLSDDFLGAFEKDQIINIHHSFLPAFMGGRPYHRAHERGVKLVGATAHYVTAKLDEGPIIEQDVIQISHRDSPNDLLRKGRIVERNVLAKALSAHLDDRVITYKNKCIVFGD